ncbi:hypothetical protein EYZ11_006450 [Aspergillus tanneri]|uniref:FAD/NAD(P)-binding domain-containing protein n=1 Tax=Aspergillus tanneri TaxID=1220188 RepID=A0A4S3JFV3_9EURO|nr:hypothetical protein EYZ11_006450 [Aspergillus tanneri]
MSEYTPVDVLIIGAGPAGLSAALSLAGRLHTAIVFDNCTYRNANALHMHLLPTWDRRSPTRFRSQAKTEIVTNYSTVRIVEVEVKKAEKINDSLFQLTDGKTIWQGKKLILATGLEDVFPHVRGYAYVWRKGIFHCRCQRYGDRNTSSAGVLAITPQANVRMAIHQAETAAEFCSTVTIYTNGAGALATELSTKLPHRPDSSFKVDNRLIANLSLDYGAWPQSSQVRLVAQLGIALATETITGSVDIAVSQPFLQTNIQFNEKLYYPVVAQL